VRRAAIALAGLLLAACAATTPPVATPPTQPAPEAVSAPRPKIGLALGGGGARGFAEIGVLRVLEQEKIPVDIVVGTSVGSLIGALYADTGSVLDLEFSAIPVTEEDIFDYRALSIFTGGFVKGERLEAFLNGRLKHRNIEEMAVRFAAVAVDLRTGERVILDRGPAARAVHASSAIPGVFVPVDVGDRTYVDGGVTDPVPAAAARELGAEVVIAVAIPYQVPPVAPKSPIAVAYHSVSIMAAEIGRCRAAEADVVITPQVGDVAYDDFSRKKQLIEAGAAATRDALPAIRIAVEAKTRGGKQPPVAGPVPMEGTPGAR
jgi:NTE family protein